MFGFELNNTKIAVKYAERVLLADKIDDRLVARSKLIIARSDYQNGNYARSSDLCNEIVSLTTNQDGSKPNINLIIDSLFNPFVEAVVSKI